MTPPSKRYARHVKVKGVENVYYSQTASGAAEYDGMRGTFEISWFDAGGIRRFAGGFDSAEAASVKQREISEASRLLRRTGFVYFGLRTTDGLIKIGFSTRPPGRARDLSLEMLACERGTYALEGELHERFADDRVEVEGEREVFRPSLAVLTYVADLLTAERERHGELVAPYVAVDAWGEGRSA